MQTTQRTLVLKSAGKVFMLAHLLISGFTPKEQTQQVNKKIVLFFLFNEKTNCDLNLRGKDIQTKSMRTCLMGTSFCRRRLQEEISPDLSKTETMQKEVSSKKYFVNIRL